MEHPNFLDKKYPDLPGSKPVERAVEKIKREGGSIPHDRSERIEAYLDRLEDIIQDKHGFSLLKYNIVEKYVTKYEDIPEGYWKAQEEEARRRGEGADWADASAEQKEDIKRKHAETVLHDQRASLEQWVDYFGSSDSAYIPKELKYWIFRSILNLQELVKKKEKESDREYIEFPKRSRGTVKPFPDINYEALAYVVDAVDKKLKGEGMEFEHDIQQDERAAFNRFLAKEDFAKLYAWANELMNPVPEHLLPVTEGTWVKYGQGSDPSVLVHTIRGKGTGWCTVGLNTARTHLKDGDFHVYYTLDDNGEPTIPRLAIRMVGHDAIAEDPRGIAYKQNLDPYMGPILEQKLTTFGTVGEKYKKKSADMKTLTNIENRAKQGQRLTKDDLIFLYEINGTIQGFGYKKDPRVKELRAERNQDEDMLVILECTKDQIAHNANGVNEHTKAYIGPWNPTVFQTIRQYPHITHLYESFPDGKIFIQTLITDPAIHSSETAGKALTEKGIIVSDSATDLLSKTEFSKNKETYELVQFTVAQLGFSNGATTKEILDEENLKKLGLSLCPAEVGPHLRAQYEGSDLKFIAMKPISGRDGEPRVFYLLEDGDGLWLLGSFGRGRATGGRAGSRFVFLSRK